MSNFDNEEAIVTTDGTGEPWNTCIWDSTTATVLATYKSSNSTVSVERGLAFIGSSYMIAAQKDKPLILVWALNKKEQVHMRIICPSKPTALAVCSNGLYLIASFDEKFHIWQLSDGKLLAVVEAHLQAITCIKFTSDNSRFVTGAADGQVFVWSLAKILKADANKKQEPLYSWADHQLQVTDIYVGYHLGAQSRVATVSHDQTCKVYKLSSGQLLISFVLDVALSSVVMDPAEYHLYIGAVNGRIYEINLFNVSADKDIHLTEKEKEEALFSGHNKHVTSLSINFDGSNLLSGSYDNTAKVWHIPSKQCIRTLNHKGPVLNVFFIPTPYYTLASEKFKPNHLICQLRREISHSEVDTLMRLQDLPSIETSHYDQMMDKNGDLVARIHHDIGNMTERQPGDSKVNLRFELLKQAEINSQLYNYAIDSVLQVLNTDDI